MSTPDKGISSDRRKPGAAFWTTVVLVVMLLYPLSFGPACWLTSRARLSGKWVTIPYRPLLWLWEIGPEHVGDFLVWYSEIGATADWVWTLHIDHSQKTEELEWGP